jgi:hypothetical protein
VALLLDTAVGSVVKVIPAHQRLLKSALPALVAALRSGTEELVEAAAAAMICIVACSPENLRALANALNNAPIDQSQLQSSVRKLMVLQQRARTKQPLTTASLMTEELKCRKQELLDFYQVCHAPLPQLLQHFVSQLLQGYFEEKAQNCGQILHEYPFEDVVTSLRKRYGAVPRGWETVQSEHRRATGTWTGGTRGVATTPPPLPIEHAVAVADLQQFYQVQHGKRAARVEEDLVERKFDDFVAEVDKRYGALPRGWEELKCRGGSWLSGLNAFR